MGCEFTFKQWFRREADRDIAIILISNAHRDFTTEEVQLMWDIFVQQLPLPFQLVEAFGKLVLAVDLQRLLSDDEQVNFTII